MNLAMINAAAARLQGHMRETPLLRCDFLDQVAERQVFVKAECLQHTGSFKFRGAWAALTALSDQKRTRGVIAFSSGNHAQGVALAARIHGVPASIIMPKDAPRSKIENTRALGAEVVLYDRAAGENRDKLGAQLSAARGLTLVRPFDDPEVIAGQGSAGLELAQQANAEGITSAEVLVCCGGGGLTSGIALALEAQAPGLRVRPVEPEGFDDVARSLEAGQIMSNAGPPVGLCDAIVTPSPGQLTFPILNRLCGPGLVVTDAQVKDAMRLAFSRLKLVLEPGGAVALAAALFHPDQIQGDTVIAVATGGNVDATVFADVLASTGSGG